MLQVLKFFRNNYLHFNKKYDHCVLNCLYLAGLSNLI
jgi:hypothetical protein